MLRPRSLVECPGHNKAQVIMRVLAKGFRPNFVFYWLMAAAIGSSLWVAAPAQAADPDTAAPPLALGRAAAPDSPLTIALDLRLGLNRSILTAPDDPVGAPQFMSGTAFNGFGFAAEGGARVGFWRYLALRLSLALSYDRATGHEDAGAWRRDLSMEVLRLRVPIVVSGGYHHEAFRVEAGLGPEIAIPVWVGASLEERNLGEEPPFPLGVKTRMALGLALAVDGAVRVTDLVWIPLGVRVSYFPRVGTTSPSRFDAFESMAVPGRLWVDYDWTVVITSGVSFEVL